VRKLASTMTGVVGAYAASDGVHLRSYMRFCRVFLKRCVHAFALFCVCVVISSSCCNAYTAAVWFELEGFSTSETKVSGPMIW